MDYGHYNCRDYHIAPHFAPTTLTNERHPLPRHESFDELEQRCRSPASRKPKFPLLQLPLELRQHILGYLLPYTREFMDSGLLTSHARNFSAVKKRQAKGMIVPSTTTPASPSSTVANIVWQRGNTSLLRVCKQLHSECAGLIYGTNTFLLFVTYSGIRFRFRWLLPSGLAPSRNFNFIELMPSRYLLLIKRVVVHIDHVDPYMGMIKFNVQGKGLTAGLRENVQMLVDALRANDDGTGNSGGLEVGGERRLAKVNIRVSNGSVVVDGLKHDLGRKCEENVKINEDVEEMLEPFGGLRGVREVSIVGDVPTVVAERLTSKMKAQAGPGESAALRVFDKDAALGRDKPPTLCVYGNDMA